MPASSSARAVDPGAVVVAVGQEHRPVRHHRVEVGGGRRAARERRIAQPPPRIQGRSGLRCGVRRDGGEVVLAGRWPRSGRSGSARARPGRRARGRPRSRAPAGRRRGRRPRRRRRDVRRASASGTTARRPGRPRPPRPCPARWRCPSKRPPLRKTVMHIQTPLLISNPFVSVTTHSVVTRRPFCADSLAVPRVGVQTCDRRPTPHVKDAIAAWHRRLRPPPAGRTRPPVDALHPAFDLRPRRRADHRARRGRLHLRRQGQALPRRARRPVRQPARPRAHRARRGRRQAGAGAGVHAAVVLRPPDRDRARRAGRALRARRPQPGVLHQRRRRGGRDRVEARQELLQAHRQADEAQGDQPGDRLPRHHPGRAVDHRPAGAQGSSSRWCPRRSGCPTPTSTAPRSTRDEPRGVRPLGRRPDRGGHRERGPRDRRRGLPRAGAERRRLLPAAARLLPAGARDLRRVRRAAGHRRGDLRVRPARPHVRRRALRLPARHDHLRQGHHLRLRAARAR